MWSSFRKGQALSFLLLFFLSILSFHPFFPFLSPLPSFTLSDSPHLAERRRYLLNYPVSVAGKMLLFPPLSCTFISSTAASSFPNFYRAYIDTTDPQLVLTQRVRLDSFLGEEWDGESWSHSIVCRGRGKRSPEDAWSGRLFVPEVYKFSAYKLLVYENQRIVNFPNCPSRLSCFSLLVFLYLFGIHKCN